MATRGKDNVRYLQPINVESGNQRNTVALKSQVLNTSITRTQIIVAFCEPTG